MLGLRFLERNADVLRSWLLLETSNKQSCVVGQRQHIFTSTVPFLDAILGYQPSEEGRRAAVSPCLVSLEEQMLWVKPVATHPLTERKDEEEQTD